MDKERKTNLDELLLRARVQKGIRHSVTSNNKRASTYDLQPPSALLLRFSRLLDNLLDKHLAVTLLRYECCTNLLILRKAPTCEPTIPTTPFSLPQIIVHSGRWLRWAEAHAAPPPAPLCASTHSQRGDTSIQTQHKRNDGAQQRGMANLRGLATHSAQGDIGLGPHSAG